MFTQGQRVLDTRTDEIGIVVRPKVKYVLVKLMGDGRKTRPRLVDRLPGELRDAPLHTPQAMRSVRRHSHEAKPEPNARQRRGTRNGAERYKLGVPS